MARKKTIPDADVLAAVRSLHSAGGDKAVSFGLVARQTGLAPSTLAQRFGTVDAMLRAARLEGWRQLMDATEAALRQVADKGPQGVLKALDTLAGGIGTPLAALRLSAAEDDSRALAQDWRQMVENALAQRLGPGDKGREAAAILFAAWQGQMLWGAEGFRVKDAVKRLG